MVIIVNAMFCPCSRFVSRLLVPRLWITWPSCLSRHPRERLGQDEGGGLKRQVGHGLARLCRGGGDWAYQEGIRFGENGQKGAVLLAPARCGRGLARPGGSRRREGLRGARPRPGKPQRCGRIGSLLRSTRKKQAKTAVGESLQAAAPNAQKYPGLRRHQLARPFRDHNDGNLTRFLTRP